MLKTIGQLTLERDFLQDCFRQVGASIPAMPDYDLQKNKLSVRRQCQLLGLNRSNCYYKPAPPDKAHLKWRESLMHRIDTLHVQNPYRGSRKLVKTLCDEGYSVSRKTVQRLMRENAYPRNLSENQPVQAESEGGHHALSAKELRSYPTQSGLVYRYHLYRHASWTYVFNRNHRLVQPENRRALSLGYARHGIRDDPCPCCRGDLWDTSNHQLRPRLPVHQQGIQGAVAQSGHPAKHGRQEPMGG